MIDGCVRVASAAISIGLHVVLLLVAWRIHVPAPPRPMSSRVAVTVLEVPRARPSVASPASPAPPPAPTRLKHAPTATPPAPPRAPEPPPRATKAPLATGVQLGNESAPVAAPPSSSPPAGRGSSASPPVVQKDLAAKRGSGAETCTEPATKPVPLSKPSRFEYTPKARAEGIEGRLLLRVTVGANGQVEDVAVENGLEPTLDAAAMASVRTWTFTPAQRCGKPVSSSYSVAGRFELGD
jgi:protein TonB